MSNGWLDKTNVELEDVYYMEFFVNGASRIMRRDPRAPYVVYTFRRAELDKITAAWRASLHSARCTWTETEEGQWDTACGEVFEFIDGGLAENGAKFCQYCGLPVREVKAKEQP